MTQEGSEEREFELRITDQFAKEYPLKILIVDDNKINQFFIIELLRKLGYQVDTASNGSEAIDLQMQNCYNFICMDISMPIMDGIEATGRIRQSTTAFRQPYIAIMTANTHLHDRERCLQAGADEYIAKPVRVQTVKESLKSAFLSQSSNR